MVLDGNSWKLVLTLDLGTETFEGSVETWLAEAAKSLKCTIELLSFDGKLADVVVRVGKASRSNTRRLSNLESMQQHIQDLLENPLAKHVRQMQEMFSNPFAGLMKQQQDLAALVAPMTVAKQMRDLHDAILGPSRVLRDSTDRLRNALPPFPLNEDGAEDDEE